MGKVRLKQQSCIEKKIEMHRQRERENIGENPKIRLILDYKTLPTKNRKTILLMFRVLNYIFIHISTKESVTIGFLREFGKFPNFLSLNPDLVELSPTRLIFPHEIYANECLYVYYTKAMTL